MVAAGRHSPQRTCLGCRMVKDQPGLVRFVRSPDGAVLVDYRGKLPGRGAYTCMQAGCIANAVNRKQFDRTFRASCQPQSADELIAGLIDALQEHMVALIGMARKSSQIITGGNLVADALDRPEKLALILLAGDVSEGIAEKIERKARGRNVPCLRFSNKADLGRMLGRGERSVTALSKGRLAEAFLAEWQKFKEISGER